VATSESRLERVVNDDSQETDDWSARKKLEVGLRVAGKYGPDRFPISLTEAQAQEALSLMRSEIPSLKQVIADMLPYLSSVWDEGPEGEGWQSDKLRGVIARAEEAIK
jgi:hypothetical protein